MPQRKGTSRKTKSPSRKTNRKPNRRMSAMARKGLAIRRELRGSQEVDRSMAEIADDDFLSTFFEYTHEACFGAVWGRPGLDTRTRHLLTLTIMAALGQAAGLESVIRRALRGGISREEMAEVFLRVYSYAGMYASWSAFEKASETFRLIDQEEAEGSQA
jgi:4-carboxymuconolactone decarboxylase